MNMKSCKAHELAEHLHARMEGEAEAKISGLANPEGARPEDLIYVDSARGLERAVASAACCVLAAADLELPGKTVLRVGEPKLAFAQAGAWLLSPSPLAAGIHPSAIIAPSAHLGENVVVGPFAVLEDAVEIGAGSEVGAHCFVGHGATIGAKCRLYPRVTLYPGARLGRRVVVHSGAVIGGDGFGYVFGEGRQWKFPQIGTIEIGDDAEIGSNTTIDRGSLGATRIAVGVKIDNLVQVGHNSQIGDHSVLAGQSGISGSCIIGRRVMIGGQAGLGERCVIEDGVMIAGQTGILPGKRIPAGQLISGTPARPFARFQEQIAWFGRLPELAERVRKLETARADSGESKNDLP